MHRIAKKNIPYSIGTNLNITEMSANNVGPSPDGEVLRQAFPDIHEDERPRTMLSYGLPFQIAIKKHVDGFIEASRVYIIASKTIAANTDNVTKLEKELGNKHVGTWLGISAHTPYDGVLPILHDMKKKHVDCVVTLGGGSLADGAKLLVYAIENGVDSVEDFIRLEEPFREMAPEVFRGTKPIGKPAKISSIFVPTTLSGAEYSRFAGCTNPRNHMKVQWTHPSMFAKLIVLSEQLCRTTPKWVWISTGVRAIDHCVENICSTNARPECDVACERGLKQLVHGLLAYNRVEADQEAKLESQLGCNNAMSGLTLLVMCGASHGIGHNLGPLGIGHGQTSCILLPAAMRYNARANEKQQAVIKDILWSDSEIAKLLRGHGLEMENSDAGGALRAVFNELGMPASLKDVGIGRDKWDQLATNSLQDSFCKVNPVPLTRADQVKEILEMCSGD